MDSDSLGGISRDLEREPDSLKSCRGFVTVDHSRPAPPSSTALEISRVGRSTVLLHGIYCSTERKGHGEQVARSLSPRSCREKYSTGSASMN